MWNRKYYKEAAIDEARTDLAVIQVEMLSQQLDIQAKKYREEQRLEL